MKRVAFLALLLCRAVCAQNVSGSLSGSIQDSTGSAFAGADVRISHLDTGFLRTARTTDEGFFSFPDLVPGVYRLEVASAGFKQFRLDKVEINSGDSRSIGVIKMELGAVTESVTVTGEVTTVAMGGSERVGVLTSTDIQSLALRGRDFMDVVGLLPGVVDTSEGRVVSRTHR